MLKKLVQKSFLYNKINEIIDAININIDKINRHDSKIKEMLIDVAKIVTIEDNITDLQEDTKRLTNIVFNNMLDLPDLQVGINVDIEPEKLTTLTDDIETDKKIFYIIKELYETKAAALIHYFTFKESYNNIGISNLSISLNDQNNKFYCYFYDSYYNKKIVIISPKNIKGDNIVIYYKIVN